MLNLYIHAPVTDFRVFNIDSQFGLWCDAQWFNPMAVRLIEEIDGNKYIGNGVSDSPYLGIIAPAALSGGIKTLIYAMNNPATVCPLQWLGQNLSKILVELSNTYDVSFVYTGSCFLFENDQKIYLPEYNTSVTGNDEFEDFLARYDLYDTVASCFKIEFEQIPEDHF